MSRGVPGKTRVFTTVAEEHVAMTRRLHNSWPHASTMIILFCDVPRFLLVITLIDSPRSLEPILLPSMRHLLEEASPRRHDELSFVSNYSWRLGPCWYAHSYSRKSFVDHSPIDSPIPSFDRGVARIGNPRCSPLCVARTSLTANFISGCFGMRPSRRLEKVIDLVANTLSPRWAREQSNRKARRHRCEWLVGDDKVLDIFLANQHSWYFGSVRFIRFTTICSCTLRK